jgi:endonuclease YncB( thermonuclease family)
MSSKKPLFVCAMALLLLPLVFAPRSYGWSGKAVAVENGGRITVARKAGRVKVVLYGIVCPRRGETLSNDALYLVCWLVLGRRVAVTPVGLDSGEEIPALVKIAGSPDYLNSQLIGYGMARLKNPHPVMPLCKQWQKLQNLARINRIGLWADGARPLLCRRKKRPGKPLIPSILREDCQAAGSGRGGRRTQQFVEQRAQPAQ